MDAVNKTILLQLQYAYIINVSFKVLEEQILQADQNIIEHRMLSSEKHAASIIESFTEELSGLSSTLTPV